LRYLARAKSFTHQHPIGVAVGGLVGLASVIALINRKTGARIGPERYRIFDGFIDEASAAYNLEAPFIRAVIRTESDFQPNVVSRKGAMGLMQIMPSAAERCGEAVAANPFDPRLNILCGTSILAGNLVRYDGDLELTLAAYNAGPGRAFNPPLATRIYTARVLHFYEVAVGEALGPEAAV
jgi:soluble lytic murein transglycosylase-like protein